MFKGVEFMKEHLLKENGLKNTAGRVLILNVLEDSKEPMTADEIYIRTRQEKNLNFSTVYRTLSILSEKKIILKNISGDGKAYYQINNHSHSHYLVCSECRKRIPIDQCPLKEIGEKLVEQTGFHITGHNLEFVGECPECFERKNNEEKL